MGPLCTHSTSPCKEQNRHAFRGTTRPRRQETQTEKERGRNEKRDYGTPWRWWLHDLVITKCYSIHPFQMISFMLYKLHPQC